MTDVDGIREKIKELREKRILISHNLDLLDFTACWLIENGFHWDQAKPNAIKWKCAFERRNKKGVGYTPTRFMGYKLIDGTEGECPYPPFSDAVVFNKQPGYVYSDWGANTVRVAGKAHNKAVLDAKVRREKLEESHAKA